MKTEKGERPNAKILKDAFLNCTFSTYYEALWGLHTCRVRCAGRISLKMIYCTDPSSASHFTSTLTAVHLSETINYGDEKETHQSETTTSLTRKGPIKWQEVTATQALTYHTYNNYNAVSHIDWCQVAEEHTVYKHTHRFRESFHSHSATNNTHTQ